MSTGTTPSSLGARPLRTGSSGDRDLGSCTSCREAGDEAVSEPTVGSGAFLRQRTACVRDRRIPEQVFVDACRERGVDLRPDLALAVLDAEREVLEPGHDSRPRPAHCSIEVEQRPAHDRVGPPLGIADPVLVRPPVRRIEHRRDVVDLACDGGHVLRDLVGPRGRDAEDRRAEEGRRAERARGARSRESRRSRPPDRPEPRNDHRSERPVGPADVVVEDVVDAELRRGDGEVDVVGLDVGMDVVREAAVAARVGATVWRLDHELATAVRPRPLGQDRIAKCDEASDHSRAAIVQELHRLGEVVRVPLGTDLPGDRHAGAPADDAELVLDVELDRVDPPLGEQAQHASPQPGMRPGVRAHVHRPHRVPRQAWRRADLQPAVRDVAGRRRGRSARPSLAVRARTGRKSGPARRAVRACRSRAAASRAPRCRATCTARRAGRPSEPFATLIAGARVSTAERPRGTGVVEQAAGLRDLDGVLAVCQPPGPEHDPAVVGGHASGNRTSVEPPAGGREVALVSLDGERERGETALADDRGRRACRVERAGPAAGEERHEQTHAGSSSRRRGAAPVGVVPGAPRVRAAVAPRCRRRA